MIKKYSELLPQYLDGENINKHSLIIETQDTQIDEKIQLLKQWNLLDRPILIEKVQTRNNIADMRVHINVDSPIKQVKILIDVEGTTVERKYDYSENDLITNVIIENTEYDQIHDAFFLKYRVIVETFDGYVYKKGYPENDDIKQDIYDHDSYLDVVGALFGISRRIYKDWTIEGDSSDLSSTCPPYFAKYDADNNMIAGTEDDYYFVERIKYFIENRNNMFLPALMMKILFEWEHITVTPTYNRKTSIIEPILNSFYMITTDDESTYINIDDTQREQKIKQYDILTRPSMVSYTRSTTLTGTGTYNNVPPNHILLKHILRPVDDDSTVFITDAPFTVGLDGDTSRICYSDRTLYDSDDDMYLLPVAPLPTGTHTLNVNYLGEYELLASNSIEYDVTVDNEFLLLNLDAWKYKKAYGTTTTIFAPPRITNDDCLSVGRGHLVYTPAVYVPFIDESIVITIIFKYGYKYSTLGFGGIIQVTSESIDRKDKGMYFNAYDKLGESNYGIEQVYSIHIENNYCYTYLNGIKVSQRQNLTGREDILCILGYSNTTETDANQRGLYIQNITLTKARAMNLETTNKKIIERTDKPAARMPELTVSGYDVGNWHVPHFTDIKVDSTTRNVTITVQIHTTLTPGWRIGFGKDNGTGTGWGRTFFGNTDATYTAGEHEITFICDDVGTWTALFDGEPCRMPPFVLDTEKNFACYVSYDTGQIFIKNINIGGNNVVST